MGTDPDPVLVRIDPRTGIGSTVVPLPNFNIVALAFAPDDTLYGIRDTGFGFIDRLVKIDLATGGVTEVGLSGLRGIQSLEFSPAGVLYGWDIGAGSANPGLELVTINTATGIASDVSAINNSVVNPVQGLAFSRNGMLYGAEASLYSIDITTGQLHLVGATGTSNLRGIGRIPEPASLALCSFGGLMLLSCRRRVSRD